MKKVLIATDGSFHAMKAVEFGSEIAAKFGADMVLVHVLLREQLTDSLRHYAEVELGASLRGHPLHTALSAIPEARFPSAGLEPVAEQTPDSLIHTVANNVLAKAEGLARDRGVSNISKRIEDGNAASRILAVANDEGADVIVTGARGLSGLETIFVGSVSHKIANTAAVTCIVVR